MSSTQVSLRFADAETLDKVLAVVQGAVSPLAVVNDVEGQATLAVDKDVIEASDVLVHPLRNDRSIRLKAADLVKVCLGFPFFVFLFGTEGLPRRSFAYFVSRTRATRPCHNILSFLLVSVLLPMGD